MGEPQLQIGTVAELTEVSVPTLRHWEKVGLVEPSARSAGGFRLYTERDVDRLRTVRRMKPLGFSLDDMAALLAALDVLASTDSSTTERETARTFLAECEERVAESITRLQRHLDYAHELGETVRRLGS